jgi:hypothetical protein
MASINSLNSNPHSAELLPHPSTRVALINAALRRLWDLGFADEPSLDPEAIILKASGKTRLGRDRLAPDWCERLTLLTHDLQHSAALTELGRTIAHGQLVTAAANMLRMLDLWHRHPEIADAEITRPILVVGQMRSGTTRIQRLLACDPRFRFTRFYESWIPLPGGRAQRWLDDRPWRARAALLAAHGLNPKFAAIHPTSASAPDEEIGLFNLLMLPAAFEAQWRLPRLVHYCEAMDSRAAYRSFKHMLKTIAWLRSDPGSRAANDTSDARPWILKVPQFTEDLDALLGAFPDARIVHVTRAEDDVVASAASLVLNQMRLQSDAVDRIAIGREWQRKVALRDSRTAQTLAATLQPRVSVDYADVERDWRTEMARVYAMLDVPLTENELNAMAAYLDRAERSAKHRHDYDPADFGL